MSILVSVPAGAFPSSTALSCPVRRACSQLEAGHSQRLYVSLSRIGYPPSRTDFLGLFVSGSSKIFEISKLESLNLSLRNVLFPPFSKSQTVIFRSSALTLHQQFSLVSSLYQAGSLPQASSHILCTRYSSSSSSRSSSVIRSVSVMEMCPK